MIDEEIYKGFCLIGNEKAPRIDGYKAVFFKKVWPIIKKGVCNAIKELFRTSIMYKAISCTTIILLPKVSNPETIREYIPIAC